MNESASSSRTFDLGLGLEGTHVLITGGDGLIGRYVVKAFLTAGCRVTSADLSYSTKTSVSDDPNLFSIHVDITSAESLDNAFAHATSRFGPVATCVALAGLDLSVIPASDSTADADLSVWQRVMDVNVIGTMATARCWARGLREHQAKKSDTTEPGTSPSTATTTPKPLRNMSLILTGSEAGHFGVRTHPAYAASKSAIQVGLLQSLRADLPHSIPGARVNAIAPGPVDTPRFHDETGGPGTKGWWTECRATTALGVPVPGEAVARAVVWLASERWSGNVHGQVVNVDSGKQGAVMWQPEEV